MNPYESPLITISTLSITINHHLIQKNHYELPSMATTVTTVIIYDWNMAVLRMCHQQDAKIHTDLP